MLSRTTSRILPPALCATPLPEGGVEGSGRVGVTLVELCVTLLLLFLVFTGWVRMSNLQAVRKESLRYAAVEKAAGMLEVVNSEGLGFNDKDGTYLKIGENGVIDESNWSEEPSEEVLPLWDDDTPIGYQCRVEVNTVPDSTESMWGTFSEYDGNDTIWIVVELFDSVGSVRSKVKPFASLRMLCKAVF